MVLLKICVHLNKQTNTNTMENSQKETINNSISESLVNTLNWFELATNRKLNRDSIDWAILEQKIFNCLVKNSN